MKKIIIKLLSLSAISAMLLRLSNGFSTQTSMDLALLQMQNTDLSLYTNGMTQYIRPITIGVIGLLAIAMFRKEIKKLIKGDN